MRRYETFVIIDPDLSQDIRDQVVERVEELIAQMDGFLVLTDDWGERKLAYEIKKRARGYYVRFDYCGLSPLVNEIERFFRIDDRALKYMTVLLDKDRRGSGGNTKRGGHCPCKRGGHCPRKRGGYCPCRRGGHCPRKRGGYCPCRRIRSQPGRDESRTSALSR